MYVGCIWLEYGQLLEGLSSSGPGWGPAGAAGVQAVTGNGLAFMAGRVSYTFGFTGGGGGGGAGRGAVLGRGGQPWAVGRMPWAVRRGMCLAV